MGRRKQNYLRNSVILFSLTLVKMYELAPVKWGAANQELARINPYSGFNTLNVGNTYPWYGESSTGMGVPLASSKLGVGAFTPRGAPGRFSSQFGTHRFGDCNCGCKKCQQKEMRFGKKRRKKAKRRKTTKKRTNAGWCIKKNRVVRAYKFTGLAGKRYGNKRKTSKRCYKTKKSAQTALAKSRKRKTPKRRTTKTVYRYRRRKPRTIYYDRYYTSGSVRRARRSRTRDIRRAKRDARRARRAARRMYGFGQVVNPANAVNYQYQQYATNVGTPTGDQMKMVSHTPAYAYPTAMRNQTWYTPKYNHGGYGF